MPAQFSRTYAEECTRTTHGSPYNNHINRNINLKKKK